MTVQSPATMSPEPNVTPMIDVLLVLLITFMVMVVQAHHSMDAQLPIPCGDACIGEAPIVLEVMPGPSYRLNRAPVAATELRARLAAVYSGRPNKAIQIAGHPSAKYDDVVSAMDVAKAAGVTVIGVSPKSIVVGGQAP